MNTKLELSDQQALTRSLIEHITGKEAAFAANFLVELEGNITCTVDEYLHSVPDDYVAVAIKFSDKRIDLDHPYSVVDQHSTRSLAGFRSHQLYDRLCDGIEQFYFNHFSIDVPIALRKILAARNIDTVADDLVMLEKLVKTMLTPLSKYEISTLVTPHSAIIFNTIHATFTIDINRILSPDVCFPLFPHTLISTSYHLKLIYEAIVKKLADKYLTLYHKNQCIEKDLPLSGIPDLKSKSGTQSFLMKYNSNYADIQSKEFFDVLDNVDKAIKTSIPFTDPKINHLVKNKANQERIKAYVRLHSDKPHRHLHSVN